MLFFLWKRLQWIFVTLVLSFNFSAVSINTLFLFSKDGYYRQIFSSFLPPMTSSVYHYVLNSISLRKPPSLSWDESPALTGLSWSSCSGGCSSQNIHGIQLKRMVCGCVFWSLTKIWQEKRALRVVCLHVALQGAGSNTLVGEKLVEGSVSWSCLGMRQSILVAVVDLAGPEQ